MGHKTVGQLPRMYDEMYSWLQNWSENTKADDRRFGHVVKVIHEDGSCFVIENAFVASDSGMWLGIISEHCGVILLYREDVYRWTQAEYPRKKRVKKRTRFTLTKIRREEFKKLNEWAEHMGDE